MPGFSSFMSVEEYLNTLRLKNVMSETAGLACYLSTQSWKTFAKRGQTH
jgi:hypothetical protein